MDAVLKTQPRPELVTSVLAVDDQPVFLRAVRELINATAGMFVAGEAGRGEEAVELAEGLRPDLVLMDVYMPGLGGVEAAREIKAGLVWVNGWDACDITMPFGGFKQSGFGRDRSLHALYKYADLKSVSITI